MLKLFHDMCLLIVLGNNKQSWVVDLVSFKLHCTTLPYKVSVRQGLCLRKLSTPCFVWYQAWQDSFWQIQFSGPNRNTNIFEWNLFANMITNIFRLTYFGEYKNNYIKAPFCFRQIQIQIDLVLPKMGKYEYKYDYSGWNLQIQKHVLIL